MQAMRRNKLPAFDGRLDCRDGGLPDCTVVVRLASPVHDARTMLMHSKARESPDGRSQDVALPFCCRRCLPASRVAPSGRLKRIFCSGFLCKPMSPRAWIVARGAQSLCPSRRHSLSRHVACRRLRIDLSSDDVSGYTRCLDGFRHAGHPRRSAVDLGGVRRWRGHAGCQSHS